jgi:hypothetical protein
MKFIVNKEYIIRNLNNEPTYVSCYKKTNKTITFILTELNDNNAFTLKRKKLIKELNDKNIEVEYIKWEDVYLFPNNICVT